MLDGFTRVIAEGRLLASTHSAWLGISARVRWPATELVHDVR